MSVPCIFLYLRYLFFLKVMPKICGMLCEILLFGRLINLFKKKKKVCLCRDDVMFQLYEVYLGKLGISCQTQKRI